MASKKHDNPYDNRLVQNAIRATTLLINIGTNIVQELLDKCVQNDEKQFQNVLYENKSYQGLAEFLQQNRQRINNLKLFDEQRTRLYPSPTTTATSVNKFDMTLCFLLLRHIIRKPQKGWYEEPADDDASLQAAITWMTHLRNMNYGHVSEMRLEDDQLERLKTMRAKNISTKDYSFLAMFEISCRNILIHIANGDKETRLKQFEKCLMDHLRAELGTNDINKYKDKINLTFASDLEAVESVRNFIEKSYFHHEKVVAILNSIKNTESETSTTVNLVMKNQKMLNTGIKEILANAQCTHISLAKIYAQNESVMVEIQNSTRQIIEKLGQKIANESERLTAEICSQVGSQIDQACSTLLTQNEETTEKLVESFAKSVKIEFKFCKEISLEELKEYFQYSEKYLRVLLINIQTFHLAFQKDREVLLKAIAESEWNVIIHICKPCEENKHLSSDICKRFRKNYFREDPFSLQKISDLSLIFKNEKMLYVNVWPEEESEQSYTESLREYFIEKFPKDILKEATVVCVNYLPNGFYEEDHLEVVDELNKAFRDGLLRITGHEKIELSLEWTYLVSKDLNLRLQEILNKKPPTKVKKYFLPSTTAQITNSLLQLLPREEREDFQVPGKDGDILWTKENQKRYEAYFEVYHKNVGSISEENSTESYWENKKKNFILGDEIDPETIFINDHLNFTTYVNCSLIDDYKNKIVLKAKKKEFFKNNQLIYPIQHEPSCGGTTIGRVLLFRLSKTLPCVRLKYLDKDDVMVEGLNKLGLDSDLPVVMLIDTESVFYGEPPDLTKVEEFSKRLRIIEYRPHFIVLVYRSFSGTNLPKLTDKDIQKYQKLYEPYISQTNLDFKQSEYRINLLNIRLMLLQISVEKLSEAQKHEQKQKLSSMCKSYVENFNEHDRDLIILMHFWAKFSSNGFMNSTIVSLLFGEIDQKDLVHQFKQFVEDTNQKPFSDVFNMVFYQARKGFKLIDSRMSEFFIQLIAGDTTKPVEEFFRIIIKILRNCCEGAKKDELDEVIKLTSILFIPKLTLKNPSSEKKLYLKDHLRNSNSEEDVESFKSFPIISKSEFFSPLVEESIAILGVEVTSDYLIQLTEIYQEIRKNFDINKLPFLISLTARFEFHAHKCQINGIRIMKKALGVQKSICIEYLKLDENVKSSDLLTSYGDLHRHYMNYLIYSKTASLSGIEEVAFESLFSYEKAHDLDRNNPFALIGECKLRKSIIRNIYFGLKCAKKHHTFKSKINDKDFELAKKSFVAINQKIDILTNLREQINDFDGIFQDCVINTVELFNESRSIETLFMETPVSYVNLNAFEVIRLNLQKKTEKMIEWKDLQSNHLEMIIDRSKLQLNENREYKASNDFRNLILAYIYAAMKTMSHQDIGNMDAALSRAKQWKIKYPNEPDSHYYFGVLKLIEYVDTSNIQSLKEANSNLEQCKKIYQEMKNPCAPRGFNTMEFLIGKQTGLQRLVQHDNKANIEKLQEFEEELESYHHTPVFRLNKIVELKCLSNRAFHDDDIPKKADAGKHPRYKFFISIRRSGLSMFKYRCCNDS